MAAWWLAVAGLSAIVVLNTLPFYSFRADLPFLLEKAAAYRDPVWRVSFYLHITGGLVCLVSPLPLFSRVLLSRARWLHRRLGQLYTGSVLFVVVPTGLYMALYAKGGALGTAGFAANGAVMFYATLLGYRTIRRGQVDAHLRWMIRSYAMVLVALSFRILYIGFFWYGLPDATGYVSALWLSFFINLAGAELLAFRNKRRNSKESSDEQAVSRRRLRPPRVRHHRPGERLRPAS